MRSVRIRSAVRHGDNTWAAVFQYKIFVRKRLPVNRCVPPVPSPAVKSPLAHEQVDKMEARRLESVDGSRLMHSCRKFSDVFGHTSGRSSIVTRPRGVWSAATSRKTFMSSSSFGDAFVVVSFLSLDVMIDTILIRRKNWKKEEREALSDAPHFWRLH